MPKEIGFSKKGISLGEIFSPPAGADFISFSFERYSRWKKIQNKLLDRIERGIPENLSVKNEMSIGEIFRPPGNSTNFITTMTGGYSRWRRIQLKILDKIEESVPDVHINGEMSISEIFRPPGGAADFFTSMTGGYRRWRRIQKKILDNIETGIPETISVKNEMGLNDIMGVSPETGLITSLRWKLLQWRVLGKIEKGLPETISVKNEMGLNDIMGVSPKMGILTSLKWGMLQRSIIGKIQKGMKDSDAPSMPSVPSKQPRDEKGRFTKKDSAKPEGHEFKSFQQSENSVKISGFTKVALRDLRGIASGGSGTDKGKDKDKKEGSMLGSIMEKMGGMKGMMGKAGGALSSLATSPAGMVLGAGLAGAAVGTAIYQLGVKPMMEKRHQAQMKEDAIKAKKDEKEEGKKLYIEQGGEAHFRQLIENTVDPSRKARFEKIIKTKGESYYEKLSPAEQAKLSPVVPPPTPPPEIPPPVPVPVDTTKVEASKAKDIQQKQSSDRMSKDMSNLMAKMSEVMGSISDNASRQIPQSGQAPEHPSISESSGTMRDPAYILRGRTWDRIRKGYVVI